MEDRAFINQDEQTRWQKLGRKRSSMPDFFKSYGPDVYGRRKGIKTVGRKRK